MTDGVTRLGHVEDAREDAYDALLEYTELARAWNAPDDEHTQIQLRGLVEEVIAEVFGR